MDNRLKPPPGSKCEEASFSSGEHYVPCGRPAAFVVRNRDASPYNMCETCADHNVKNRGAMYVTRGDMIVEPVRMADDGVEPMDTPADADLASVAALAAAQRTAEARVAAAEAELAAAQKELAAVRDDQLPRTMLALGLSDFRLTDGARVAVREHYRCGQLDDGPDKDGDFSRRPLEDRLRALQWLDDSGHGDVARRVVTVTLGADAAKLADEIIALIRSHRAGNRLVVDHRRTVPWNTLSKLVRELATRQEDPPLDLLGVTVQTSAKITPPSEKESF